MKVLIVGAGLAGYSAAHHLKDSGADITLIDNGKNVSSAVAAGIINPVVFRRTTLSWRLREMITYAYPFYRNLEKKLNTRFFREVPIRRLFAHEQEKATWEKKQVREDYSPYLKTISEDDTRFPMEQNTFGTGVVLQSASVETKKFLEANRSYFAEMGALRTEDFQYGQLDPENGVYQDEQFDLILFCEGKDGLYNPWFSYLPLNQTKGEVLTIRLDGLPDHESLNRKCFLMPQTDGTWKTGSNYIWNTDDSTPTEEGKRYLLNNLLSITDKVPVIVTHEAGVRPTVEDRRPLLGKHQKFQKLAILNGLGTKGYMLAPLIAKELVDFLLNGAELDPESDIRRFGFSSDPV